MNRAPIQMAQSALTKQQQHIVGRFNGLIYISKSLDVTHAEFNSRLSSPQSNGKDKYCPRPTKNSTTQTKYPCDKLPLMIGLRFQNGQPAQMGRGKYVTRNNRLATIDGSHQETVRDPSSGVESTRTIWDGALYNADHKTVASPAKWNDQGGYNLHVESVPSEFDLCTVIEQQVDSAAPASFAVGLVGNPAREHLDEASSAALENQLLCAALVDELNKQVIPGDEGISPLVTLKRIISERDAAHARIAQLLATPVA